MPDHEPAHGTPHGTPSTPATPTDPHPGPAPSDREERLLVLRPATVAVATPDGLFVRTLQGEHTLRAPALGRTWPRLAGHLETGIGPERLPRSLLDALLSTGAAVLVPAAIASSELPWHRYALSWAADPTAAIDRIATTVWEPVGDGVETGALRAAARDWGLDGQLLPTRPGAGLRLYAHSGAASTGFRLTAGGGDLVAERIGTEPAADAAGTADTAADRLPTAFAPPVRALAAAAVLHAALAEASGPDGWHWPQLPLSIDPLTLTLTDADGSSSR
ncbi:hypothetical protein [Streptomyces sp. NBC_00454]|uniref:hypothetical protein n=1 Tax=Streptomyces sp. NBC_00454 TaxID=2975747 RepID=UPI0030DE4302